MTLQKKRYKKIATMRPSKDVEKNFLPSETVPDQSMSVREIMQKFASGTLGDISTEPYYNEDLPDLRGLDISQVHQMRDKGRADYQELLESAKKAKGKKPEAEPIVQPEKPEE